MKMILDKLAELEGLVDVTNVDKSPTESLKGMVMLNLIVEIRGLVAELKKPLPTDEQIEQYALENILESDSIMGFGEMQRWIAGAIWMRDLIRDKSERVGNDTNATIKNYTEEDMEEFSFWYHRKVSVIGESELHLFGVRPFGDIIDFWKNERSKK